MKENIIRAILYQDMSVKWKSEFEMKDGVNIHLNVHQKTRQFVEVELGDFVLNTGEAILAAFEKSIDGEIYHVNPTAMEKAEDSEEDKTVFRLQIPTIVHNTPGRWGVQFSVVTDYDSITGYYTECYPFNIAQFSEYSSFIDDGLTVPSKENLKALYDSAKNAAETVINARIVQETGTATDKVMSQKAVTDELDNINLQLSAKADKTEFSNYPKLTDGKIPSSYLPSYVDDVLEYDEKNSFPATGETGKIYVDKTTNLTYRWSGSTYIMVGGEDYSQEITEIKASLAEKADKTYVDESIPVLTQEKVNSLF